MTPQNWIYDPPPPPPKKALPENTRIYDSQRPANGRGGFHRGTRGNDTHHRDFANASVNKHVQQQYRQGSQGPQRGGGHSSAPSHFTPVYQQQPQMVRTQNYSQQPNWSVPAYQQHPSQQQYYSHPPSQYRPISSISVPYIPESSISASQVRQRPVYPTPSRPLPGFSQSEVDQSHHPKNAYGYTLSETAYSLPAHHYKPHRTERPDLSEEELRHTLEQQLKNKPQSGYGPEFRQY